MKKILGLDLGMIRIAENIKRRLNKAALNEFSLRNNPYCVLLNNLQQYTTLIEFNKNIK